MAFSFRILIKSGRIVKSLSQSASSTEEPYTVLNKIERVLKSV